MVLDIALFLQYEGSGSSKTPVDIDSHDYGPFPGGMSGGRQNDDRGIGGTFPDVSL